MGRPGVDAEGVVGGEAEERVRGHVDFEGGKVRREAGVGVAPDFGEVGCAQGLLLGRTGAVDGCTRCFRWGW